MRAALYEEFQGPVCISSLADPAPVNAGVVLKVAATGICRSDWHGWMGYDPDVVLPHVPGHEIAGIVAAVGRDVQRWQVGDRVTLPFVCGCGVCGQCKSGNQQTCDNQFQPGFTAWGSYAQYVAIDYADVNLVALPDDIDFVTAASLGCRFATAFRGVVALGGVSPEKWVVVHGCGGVGLSAVMIAAAFDAYVVAVDIDETALQLATKVGATATLNAASTTSIVDAVRELTGGGAHLSVDALGSSDTCYNSIANLRKHGRHVQIGLMAGDDYHPSVPMELVVANELEIVGSHGMQAHEYGGMLQMMSSGKLRPQDLVGQTIDLECAARALGNPGELQAAGITVIDRF